MIAQFTVPLPAAEPKADAESTLQESERPGDAPPTDLQITIAVEGDLLFDWPVSSSGIDVSTADGIVTLSGWVPNIMSKDRAAMIAEGVRGVRSVIDKIEVRVIDREDAEIRQDVQIALKSDPATDELALAARVDQGVVTLSGTAHSWQEKELAAYVAKGVRGVTGVANHIEVAYGVQPSDNDIAEAVRAVLERDVWVSGQLINVAVKDGVVTLSGNVGSLAQKTRAKNVSYVNGALSVNNDDLEVNPSITDDMRRPLKATVKTDAQIKDAIRDAFLLDPRVMSFNPDITVQNGLVVLSGTVDNLKARRAAEQDARNTVGVWRVKSYLKVRGEDFPPDLKVAENVEQALGRDPWESEHEISVTVRNGVATLRGTVDSEFEKTHAGDIASRTRGVIAVNNHLNVSFPGYTYYRLPHSHFYYTPSDAYFNPRAFGSRPLITSAPPGTTDAEIKDEVEDELFWSPFIQADDIDVSVMNGVVTLTGKVDNRVQFDNATENAFEGGARMVINNLRIE